MMVDRHHPGLAPTALLQKLSGGLCLTIEQLADDLDLTRRQVSDAASNLSRRGYLERREIGCYQLTPAGLAAAAAKEVIRSGPKGPSGKPRQMQDTFRQRAWTSMRGRRLFTMPDILMDAARAHERNAKDNLRRYLRVLERVGYVAVAAQRIPGAAPTSNGHKFFRLLRSTGMQAPVALSQSDGIHDFNLGRDVLVEAAECGPR